MFTQWKINISVAFSLALSILPNIKLICLYVGQKLKSEKKTDQYQIIVSSPDPKCHVSYCYHWASVVRRRPSLAFCILINSSETTGPIQTKLGRDGPWVVPFQNCVRRPRPPTKLAATAKNRKFNKNSLKISSETAQPVGTKL